MAIRRKIIKPDGDLVRPCTATMAGCSREEFREMLCSVMRKGTTYDREDVIQAVARYLGFARVADAVRDPIKPAINSAIGQGILEGDASSIRRVE